MKLRVGQAILVSFVAVAAYMWAVMFGNSFLPTRWMAEWYGFPLSVTEIVGGILIYFGVAEGVS